MENDESSIDIISDGDRIIIIEDRIYPDYSYLFSIQKKYEKEKDIKINIICKGKIHTTNFVFSSKTLVSEMINAICLFFGLDTRNLRILYNGTTIKSQNTSIWNYFNTADLVSLILYQKEDDRFFTECRFIGKLISAKLHIDKEEISIKIGRLNNTKSLFCKAHGFGLYKNNLAKLYDIYANNIKIQYEDNTIFYSLGIKEDFNCTLKLKNNINEKENDND